MPVSYKSIPEMYAKEYAGLKPNTLRKIDINDGRTIMLLNAMCGESPNFDGKIEIVNTVTDERFVRTVTDISRWEDWLIISWKHTDGGELN